MTERAPLRVGLVGAGTIAELAQLPALSRDPSVTIAGVTTASRSESERVLARWPVERAYDTADQMLDGAALDALFVLTPKHLHTPFVRAGLAAGVSVFCEKPLAATAVECHELADLADRSAGVLMVGFNRRFAEVYQRAHRELVDAPPVFVVGQKNRIGSEYRATLENGIHMIDLLRWFCGEPVAVTAAARAPDPYQETGVAAMVQFDTGTTALFLASRAAGTWDERLEVYGEGVTVRVVAPDEVTVTRDHTSTSWHSRSAADGWVDVTDSAGFGPAVEHFLQCVRTGRRPLTDGREAARTTELTERVLAAAGLPTTDSPEHVAPESLPFEHLSTGHVSPGPHERNT